MTNEREWSVGSEIEVKGKTFRVTEIYEEPSTGLVALIEVGHPMQWRFTLPYVIVDVLYEHHAKRK